MMDISIFYTENFMTQHKRSILSPVSNNVSQHFLSLIDLVLMMVFLHDIVEMIKITNMTFRQCVYVIIL